MKTINKVAIAFCMFLTIAFLMAGTVAAYFPSPYLAILAEQHPDGYTFDFTAVDSNSSVYIWDFGDGTFTNGRFVSHTYLNSGPKIVNLEDDDGKHSKTVYPGEFI